MPEESNRTTKNKKITLPGGQTVLVPVITSISFIDPIKQYQEYQYSVDNSSQADRDVHVDQVMATDGSGTLDIERIDIWKILDPQKQYQESGFAFDNKTGSDDTPPHFRTHQKTHLVKWGDSGAWVQSELIDEFSVIDPIQQYQEHFYTLTGNPQADDNGFAATQPDPSDPDITDGSLDPPYRTDPFQNIVDFSGNPPEFFFSIYVGAFSANGIDPVDTGVTFATNPPPDGGQPTTPPFNGTGGLHSYWMSSYSLTVESHAQLILPASTTSVPPGAIPLPGGAWLVTGPGPAVSISPSSFSFDDWQVFNDESLGPQPRQVPFSPCSANIPTVPPLIVNGKVQDGWYGSLSLAMQGSGAGYAQGPMTFDTANIATGTWFKVTVAPLNDGTGGGAIQITRGMTLNISGAPFTPFSFTSQQYKAVGIGNAGGSFGVPGFVSNVTPGSNPSAVGALIFCVPA
jgi:hypothetical protein